VFKKILTMAAAVALMAGTPVLAQTTTPPAETPSVDASGTQVNGQERTITGERVTAGRLQARSRDRASAQAAEARQQQQRPRPNAAAPAATPEQVKAAATALAAATNSGCTVVDATLRGENAEKQSVYEATCATGPGFILIGTTPPQSADCVVLSGQADITRSRDAAADVGLQCTMPANQNVLAVVTSYAVEAGVHCTVDQGSPVGKSSAANVIYEIGCAGTDGYWLEKTATGWTTTECMKLVSTSATCKYTTPAEQAATLKKWFEGGAASACDVTQARYMGSNANGSFYEAKCAAGDGLIARFDNAMAVQQVYPCAEAQRIGGGCTLTVVPAAAPAAAPATQQ
jgi:hypothetical protein